MVASPAVDEYLPEEEAEVARAQENRAVRTNMGRRMSQYLFEGLDYIYSP
jgi:hypothetical protein